MTAGKDYYVNFTKQHEKVYLSLYYNGVNSYIFVKGIEIYKFKAKHFEIKADPLCLGNVSKKFSMDNMKKTRLHRHFYDILLDYDSFDGLRFSGSNSWYG